MPWGTASAGCGLLTLARGCLKSEDSHGVESRNNRSKPGNEIDGTTGPMCEHGERDGRQKLSLDSLENLVVWSQTRQEMSLDSSGILPLCKPYSFCIPDFLVTSRIEAGSVTGNVR